MLRAPGLGRGPLWPLALCPPFVPAGLDCRHPPTHRGVFVVSAVPSAQPQASAPLGALLCQAAARAPGPGSQHMALTLTLTVGPVSQRETVSEPLGRSVSQGAEHIPGPSPAHLPACRRLLSPESAGSSASPSLGWAAVRRVGEVLCLVPDHVTGF